MIVFISTFNRIKYQKYLDEYYIIRKKIFCDELKWVLSNSDHYEKDKLDESYNVTILYVDSETDCVMGGVRLVPSLGNTLIHSVWNDMLPEPDDFRSPEIWEATRYCVNDSDVIGRKNKLVNRVSLALMFAILDFANNNGISSIIAVCEKKIVNMISVFTPSLEIISEKVDENNCEICCTLWSTGPEIREAIKWARPFVGGTEPVLIDSR